MARARVLAEEETVVVMAQLISTTADGIYAAERAIILAEEAAVAITDQAR